jgi:hypothetical protein
MQLLTSQIWLCFGHVTTVVCHSFLICSLLGCVSNFVGIMWAICVGMYRYMEIIIKTSVWK